MPEQGRKRSGSTSRGRRTAHRASVFVERSRQIGEMRRSRATWAEIGRALKMDPSQAARDYRRYCHEYLGPADDAPARRAEVLRDLDRLWRSWWLIAVGAPIPETRGPATPEHPDGQVLSSARVPDLEERRVASQQLRWITREVALHAGLDVAVPVSVSGSVELTAAGEFQLKLDDVLAKMYAGQEKLAAELAEQAEGYLTAEGEARAAAEVAARNGSPPRG